MEKVFKKEFLPINELEGSWREWDKCYMEGISLNQYISNNREIVLKLKQFDEWVEALKFAKIYDNIGHKSKGAFGKSKEKESFSLKRKFFKREKGDTKVSEFFRG